MESTNAGHALVYFGYKEENRLKIVCEGRMGWGKSQGHGHV